MYKRQAQDALPALGRGDAPADVAEVAAATLAVPVPPAQLDPLVDLRDWMSGLNERDAAILHRRLIRFEGSTLDDLGLEFDDPAVEDVRAETGLEVPLGLGELALGLAFVVVLVVGEGQVVEAGLLLGENPGELALGRVRAGAGLWAARRDAGCGSAVRLASSG